MKETLITPAGLSRLCEELDRLKTAGRQDVAERIRHVVATDADASAIRDRPRRPKLFMSSPQTVFV